MLHKVTSTIFKLAVLVAAGTAMGVALAGHALGLEGLLLMMGATLAAVIFAFRLADGADVDPLSVWAGPVWSIRRVRAKSGDRHEIGQAA